MQCNLCQMTHLSRPQRAAVMMSAVVAVALATFAVMSLIPGVNALSGALAPAVMGGAALIGFIAMVLVVAGQRPPQIQQVQVQGPEQVVIRGREVVRVEYRNPGLEAVKTEPQLPLPQVFKGWFHEESGYIFSSGLGSELAKKVLDPRNGPLCYVTIENGRNNEYFRTEADGTVDWSSEPGYRTDLTPVYKQICDAEERIEGKFELRGQKYFVRYTAEGYPLVELLLDQTPKYPSTGIELGFDHSSVFRDDMKLSENLKGQTLCVKLRQASLLGGNSTKNVVWTGEGVEEKDAPEGYDLTKLFACGINHIQSHDDDFGTEFTFKIGRWEATMCARKHNQLEFRSIKLT